RKSRHSDKGEQGAAQHQRQTGQSRGRLPPPGQHESAVCQKERGQKEDVREAGAHRWRPLQKSAVVTNAATASSASASPANPSCASSRRLTAALPKEPPEKAPAKKSARQLA